jgi:uncharacterized ubiquitin-like protein YukD
MVIGVVIIKDYKKINYDLTLITRQEQKALIDYVKKNDSITYNEANFVINNSNVKRKLNYLVYKKVFKRIVEQNRVRYEKL